VARAVPLNLGGRALSDALTGRLASAALGVAGAAGLVVVLGAAWWALLARELTSSTVDATGPPRRRTGLRARTPVPAVAVRELRYLWRHPVARTNTITSVFLAGMAVLPLRAGGGPGSVLGAAAVVAAVGLSCLNVLGVDGRAAWSDAMATDLATVLRGKILARALLAGALVGPAALVVAGRGGGWAYLPAVPFLAAGGFGVIAGFGAFASVAVPVPFPDAAGGSPWRSSPGQGCVTSLLSMALFAAAGVACLPLVVGAAVGVATSGWALATVAALAPAYGWLAWRVGLGVALRRARGRTPELLAALLPG
jgi:hypothetical protein